MDWVKNEDREETTRGEEVMPSARLVGSFIATSITVGLTWVIVYYLAWIPLVETWPEFWYYIITHGMSGLTFWTLAVSVFFDILIILVVIYGSIWVLGHFAVYASRYQYYRSLVVNTPKIPRWSVSQRIQHIVLFLTLVITAYTGFVTMFNQNPVWREFYINGVYEAVGSPPFYLWPAKTGPVPLMIVIHVWAGIIMGVLVIAHFAYYGTMVLIDLVKKRGPILDRWPLLRFYTWGFVKYLVARTIWLFKPSKKLPEWTHKYDPEQLFEYWGVYWGIAILGIPGAIMAVWGPSAYDGLAFIFHVKEAILAVSFLLLVHITYTHFMPHIFPYNAMFHSGKMPEGIAREEHPLWFKSIKRL